jgi:cell division protein FtsB
MDGMKNFSLLLNSIQQYFELLQEHIQQLLHPNSQISKRINTTKGKPINEERQKKKTDTIVRRCVIINIPSSSSSLFKFE